MAPEPGGDDHGVARRFAIAAALLVLVLLYAAGAAARLAITVTPAAGSRTTRFTVSFTSPGTTGIVGTMRLRDELTARSRSVSGGCRSGVSRALPTLRRGQQLHITLAGPGWCTGTFSGKLIQLQSIVCPPRSFCPAYVRIRTLGTFSFTVR